MENGYAFDQRAAGLLLHISSLAGVGPIGNIGPAAYAFADFLHRTYQSVWQMLPVQPVSKDQGYSPYSSISAFAGNPLFISPELLAGEGLLEDMDLTPTRNNGSVNYDEAVAANAEWLGKAYANWKKKADTDELAAFERYVRDQRYWLADFALFTVIQSQQGGKAWYDWPAPLRDRNTGDLNAFAEQFRAELDKVKWVQMIFDRQWRHLREHCRSLGISLLGDVPIYVAHDSADVWSHRKLFTVNDDGRLTEIAGVPPDLFNDDGQLWGLPLYNWTTVADQHYTWWIERLRRNLHYFDLVRLDHFRGFSAYWSVPATSSSAKNGQWLPGPGSEFFRRVKAAFGGLPFVAEDLGEIDEPVYALRDEFSLPGMNVLQFAFSDDMPRSPYLPHRHTPRSVVYTGTHDNNTTTGWFNAMKKRERKNLKSYLGTGITSKNISIHLSRLAYMSVSSLVILPMQDVLSLGETARMNKPASPSGNWTWRLCDGQLTDSVERNLRDWTFYYDRRRR